MTVPIVSNELIGQMKDGIPSSKYFIQAQMPDPRAGIVMKGDIAAPLEINANGQIFTRNHIMTGYQRGPIVGRKALVASWKVENSRYVEGSRPIVARQAVTPTQVIMGRHVAAQAATNAAMRESYVHSFGQWRIWKTPAPPPPIYSPGYAQAAVVPTSRNHVLVEKKEATRSISMAQATMPAQIPVVQRASLADRFAAAIKGIFRPIRTAAPLADYDAFSISDWNQSHGVVRKEAFSPFYRRQGYGV